jgi:hypothetical protein
MSFSTDLPKSMGLHSSYPHLAPHLVTCLRTGRPLEAQSFGRVFSYLILSSWAKALNLKSA